MKRLSAALVLCLSLFAGPAVNFREPAISADGRQAAWVQEHPGETARLQIGLANGGRMTSVQAGQDAASSPAWSPDGRLVAFLTGGDTERPQLWTVDAEGRDLRSRASLKGYAAWPRWSPDGQSIAFLFTEGAWGGGPLSAAPAQTGVIDAAIHNQRIAILDMASGQVNQVSPSGLHVYDYDWSPDSKAFVATAAPGPGNNNWWIAQIYRFDLAGGSQVVYKPKLEIAVPRWSPDGRRIAFIEGLMSDEGFHGGDLLTISAEGGEPSNHTAGRKTSVSSLFWTDPDRIVFTEYVSGGSAVAELSKGAIRTLWHGAEDMHAFGNFPNFALSRDGRTAVAVRSSYDKPFEVWAGPVSSWRPLTRANQGEKPEWGAAQSLEWTNEGLALQGWLLAPKEVEPGRRYPLVVNVHGGPSGMEKPSWPDAYDLPAGLSSHGYYVLLPNPRGSYGGGEAFTQANRKDFGGGDLRDILAGVEAAAARFPIDPQRVGITGWSYGGYMTMWAVTQTNRFRAAVAGAGIANWQSYYGENLIDRWMIPFFGAPVYDDPAVYAKSSPIQFIKNAKTPTLVVVGERDAECPAPQSWEFWHALRTLGVPTQLVVYPGEGHMFADTRHRADVLERSLAWFDKYLRP